jgi:pSer/pThr/pTyr-binding forkhead associated (FHA) protein
MNVNLCLLKKDGTRKLLPLPSTVTTIGRRRDCDMRIPLPSVSRRHCELYMEKGRLMVRDLGSRNGTFLNGGRVDETAINAGDALQIGELSFVVQIDGAPENLKTHVPRLAPEVARRPADVPPAEDSRLEDMIEELSGMDLHQTRKGKVAQEQTEIY